MAVYNSKAEATRQVYLSPSDNWGGAGLAGISIRFSSFEHANEHVWHVLDVYANSPATEAGLQPRTDYIVGTPEIVFNDSEDFFFLINNSNGKAVQLYVYNTNHDNVRLVTITPNINWGGSGR